MNGPDHYAEAERLAEMHTAGSSEWASQWGAQTLAAAQVHATLATSRSGTVQLILDLVEQLQDRGGVRFQTDDMDWWEIRAALFRIHENADEEAWISLRDLSLLLRAVQ